MFTACKTDEFTDIHKPRIVITTRQDNILENKMSGTDTDMLARASVPSVKD